MYSPKELADIASRTRQDIDTYCMKLFAQEPREHLGASEIGEECQRRIWANWRWLAQKQFAPRMLRLFDRGYNTEGRCTEFLRAAGWYVDEVDPTTGEQFVFSDIGGHYGGSCDARSSHPFYFPGEWLVNEYKTHNEKSFIKLRKDGVRKSKPRHYRQHCSYGRRFGCRYGVYMGINKNDDDIHLEIVELDWTLADDLTEQARTVITSQFPLQRMKNASPSFFTCKTCEHLGNCFYRQTPDKNCRSCTNANPVDNGEWLCAQFNQIIPEHVIKVGCDAWRSIV